MKILDRYIAKNFLYGYFISLFVMIGMFLTIDLFMNLDEFAELLGVKDATGHEMTMMDVMANNATKTLNLFDTIYPSQ